MGPAEGQPDHGVGAEPPRGLAGGGAVPGVPVGQRPARTAV